MDLQEKLRLMKKYDFSRLPADGRENISGFGNLVCAIRNSAEVVSQRRVTEEQIVNNQKTILAAYGCMRSCYDIIDFGELDEADSDYHTLFETNRFLPCLGQAIHHFLLTPSAENFAELKGICDTITQADDPPYRDIIKRLESRYY